MFNLFGKGKEERGPVQESSALPLKVLVIQADKYDWKEIFKGETITDGNGENRPILVEQVGWNEIICSCYGNGPGNLIVHIKRDLNSKINQDKSEKKEKIANFATFQPDFILIRNEVYTADRDYRNELFSLIYSNIPSVNSLSSIHSFTHRPLIHSELLKLSKQFGYEKFPVIEQNFFPSHRGMMYSLPFPAVVKVGHAHAGIGKMRIKDHKDMEDFQSVLAMTNTYCTVEPFLKGLYDLRIQKIGKRIRAYKRSTISGNWKTNTGSSHIESIEPSANHIFWVEAAATMLGGLDILTVDAIHTEDNKEIILEVNGTSSGLAPEYEELDNLDIKNLVLEKLKTIYGNPNNISSAARSKALYSGSSNISSESSGSK